MRLGGDITGTIKKAYNNADGVTHVLVNVGRDLVTGPLQVRGEPLDDLPGLPVRLIDGNLWVLSKARAA